MTWLTLPDYNNCILNTITSVLKYYYERAKYNLTLTAGTGIERVIGSGSYYYEQEILFDSIPWGGALPRRARLCVECGKWF